MKKIEIKNNPNNLSSSQQEELQKLGFKRQNFLAPWIYKAEDDQDLVDVVEDLEMNPVLKSLSRIIRF